jgi:hypothetical protein
VFFNKNSPFNQGEIYTFDHDEFISNLEKSEEYVGTNNENGVKLRETFSYEKTVNSILEIMKKNA